MGRPRPRFAQSWRQITTDASLRRQRLCCLVAKQVSHSNQVPQSAQLLISCVLWYVHQTRVTRLAGHLDDLANQRTPFRPNVKQMALDKWPRYPNLIIETPISASLPVVAWSR
jgi:hypothetical protein